MLSKIKMAQLDSGTIIAVDRKTSRKWVTYHGTLKVGSKIYYNDDAGHEHFYFRNE